ncbi:hypothetical protein MesoLjLc_69320 [Mesorhizobium sp. L-8-10]|nr:hypothetical protein MesoLjLc_69320 [Mesorhizobium sp. L-8-10]
MAIVTASVPMFDEMDLLDRRKAIEQVVQQGRSHVRRIEKAAAVTNDTRDCIKRRGKAIPMNQNGEIVVEVQKALSVDVSQIGACVAARRAASDRTAAARVVPSGGRPRANNLADWRQAARRFRQTC